MINRAGFSVLLSVATAYYNSMELTYNQLKKRDVINVVDGKCLGRIVDMKLRFPQGVLQGVFVPGKKKGLLSCVFDKSSIYIDESRIIKIGGDVILVNLSSDRGGDKPKIDNCKKPTCPPPCTPCPPPCTPCPPQQKPHQQQGIDFSILSGGDPRMDEEDY